MYSESQSYEKGVKKGLTLLELIVAIIIIAVLATLSVFRYVAIIERSRGAEARMILGAIRQNAVSIWMANGNDCNAAAQICNNTNVIGSDYDTGTCANPGRTFFNYTISSPSKDGITVTATRCAAGTGKIPQLQTGVSSGWVKLVSNFSNGSDTLATSGEY